AIEIPELWMDSDEAINEAMSRGLYNYQNIHPNGESILYLFNSQPAMPIWTVRYNSPSGSIGYEIPAIDIDALHNKSQTLLGEVKALAQTFAPDAELIFVFNAPSETSYTGDGTWNYLFKSQSQQELYEFYTTLAGYIGISENVSGYFSKEDFFKCDPIPDSWLDIGSVLDITESKGGAEFRQTYPDCEVAMALCISPYQPGFNWEITYYSESSTQNLYFLIDATAKSIKDEWPKTYGGSDADMGRSVQETKDGGFIIAGYTRSFGAGMTDTWMVKTDIFGNMEWDKTHGGQHDDYARFIEETGDNEYLLAHNSADNSGIYSGNLLLTYDDGNEKLGRRFDNTGNIEVYSIHKTKDNSYILAGSSSSGVEEPSDFWLVKVD
ncbi:MAG: hypothetical protein ACP5E3_18400, partial [Bacteroidales bacterium]